MLARARQVVIHILCQQLPSPLWLQVVMDLIYVLETWNIHTRPYFSVYLKVHLSSSLGSVLLLYVLDVLVHSLTSVSPHSSF